MAENYELSKEIVDFLYNGCAVFFPDQFYPEDQKVDPAVFYSGQNKETFEQKLLEVTQAKNIQDAIQIVRGWKIAVDRGEKVASTVPTNIEELVASYEKSQEEQETPKSVEKARESIAKAQEKKQATTKREFQQKEAKEQVEVKIEDTKVNTPEINLYSPQPQTAITLTKEQQQIVKLAHQDPQKFANQLKERIIETSKLNPENPLEIDSADMVAKTLTLKLLGIDSKKPQVFIDSSPFETLAFFANPKNEELAKIIPDAKAREEISRISLEALYSLEKDSTTAANLVNKAFGQDWSPFFIPSPIRELKVSQEEKPPKGGTNVNLNEFLNQLASLQTIERQIKNTVIDKETYDNLTRQQKAKLEKEIKEAAKKISLTSRAFSFITGKKIPSPSQNIAFQTPEWINVQFASIGLLTPEQSSFVAASLNFGNFSSPNILSSPIFNFAFEKFIKKIPAVAKLNTAISGMTAKLGSKVATKIAAKAAATKLGAALAANVIPVIGQVISTIIALLSLKDLASLIKVWLKKNQDKLPFILAGLLVGAFALTGAPLYLVAGVGVIGASRAASIGAFLGGLFFALTNIVLASLVIPMLIVFIGIPILVAIILFIINSGAYVYPPGGFLSHIPPGVGGVGVTPVECIGDPGNPPLVTGVVRSGAYAFPVAPALSTSYHCYHWDHEFAVDIFSSENKPPVVAYTNGVVENVVLNDNLGGKYVILKGDDGRYYYYAHNCHIYVKVGQRVSAGELLATMDATGNGRVQHLHFAINSTSTFVGGSGDVCPQQDFIDKFGMTCLDMDMLCK